MKELTKGKEEDVDPLNKPKKAKTRQKYIEDNVFFGVLAMQDVLRERVMKMQTLVEQSHDLRKTAEINPRSSADGQSESTDKTNLLKGIEKIPQMTVSEKVKGMEERNKRF